MGAIEKKLNKDELNAYIKAYDCVIHFDERTDYELHVMQGGSSLSLFMHANTHTSAIMLCKQAVVLATLFKEFPMHAIDGTLMEFKVYISGALSLSPDEASDLKRSGYTKEVTEDHATCYSVTYRDLGPPMDVQINIKL